MSGKMRLKKIEKTMTIKHDIAVFSIDFSALQGLKTLKYMNKKRVAAGLKLSK